MAAGTTYTTIATTTLTGSTSSYTFSSIPGTYTDLVLTTSGTASGDFSYKLQFNGDTTSNYSSTYLYGDGTSTTSGRSAGSTNIVGMSRTGTVRANGVIHILNYSSATMCKTVIGYGGTANNIVIAASGLWRKTPEAITSVTVLPESGTMSAGTVLTLHGIAAA